MGVTGLWKLLESCGKPVPLETLEGKVIAVDISIWLNQAMKGYRDGQNGTVQNAHLMGVFHRVCKLLTYKIKPVFVFDGGVPALKRDTLAQRRLRKSSASSAADRSSQRLVQNLLQQEALRAVLGERAPLPLSVGGGDGAAATDPFQLPPAPPPTGANDSAGTESESSDSEAEGILSRLGQDLHSFDFDSEEFRNLEPQVKHDILSELKDTRKQSSWGKLDQMPKKADNFSDFQMERLLKRNKFQASMDEVEAEITKRNTELLHMGIDLPGTITSRQMASRSGTYLLLGHLKSDEPPAAADPEPEPEEEVDEAGLVDVANTAEYLTGADLFGGTGTAGASSSAAKVDQDMDAVEAWRNTLKDQEKPSETAAVAAETRTVEAFSEMGKKYSNLYLKFSAQWLEDEKSKSPQKPKSKVSPLKRKQPPSSVARPPGGRPGAAKKVRFDEVPTFSDLTKAEGKLTSKVGKSKPHVPVAKKTKLPIASTLSDVPAAAIPPTKPSKKGRDSRASKTPALGSALEITIDPLARPVGKDDIFQDIFSCMDSSKRDSVDSAVVLGTEPGEGGLSDDVAEMSDSGDSSSEGEAVPAVKCASSTLGKGKAALKTVCGPEANGMERKIKEMGSNVGQEVPKIGDASLSVFQGNDILSETSGEPLQDVRIGSQGKAQSPTSSEPCSSTRHAPSQRDGASSGRDQGSAHLEPAITVETDQASPGHVSSSSKAGEHVHFQPCRSVALASDEDADDPCAPHPTAPVPLLPVSPSRHSIPVPSSPPPERDPVWEELGVEPGPEPADLREEPEPADHKEEPKPSDLREEPEPDDLWEEMDPADLREEPETAALWEEVEDAELEEAARQLAERQMALLEQRGRQLRAAASVTDQMYSDVQALLELFGVPYVVSPQEAEAQCAFLEIAGLTHGTITDDSDIWLFGGQRVYKNFFNQNKFVELYQSGDIRGSLGLERGQLVCVALLTGSDYTLGVESVGCVRALEILAEFPGGGLAGLRQFRTWWELCQDGRAAARTPIRRSLRGLSLPLGFPSEAVLKAYLEPEVDTSREPFSWAPPDLDGLRLLASAKLGWGGTHTDSILQPMLKRRQQDQGQQRLDRFFQPSYASEVPVEASQRLQRAVRRVRGEPESPPAGTASGSAAATQTMAEQDSVEALMDDGMDDILASLEVPGEGANGDAGDNDIEMSLSDAIDELGEASGDEFDKPGGAAAVAPATEVPAVDVAPKQPRSGAGRPPRAGAASGSNPRTARASASKPRAPRAKKSVDANVVNPFLKRRRAVPDTAYSSGSSVPADLSDLAPKDREQVLLVRRLRERASKVRTEMRLEDPARSAAPPVKPSTKLVRKRMLANLLKENPRLKMEREDQLRKKMGLPPLIRTMGAGRSCRNPAAARSRATFEEAIVGEARPQPVRAAEASAEAAAPTGLHGGVLPLESASVAGLSGAGNGPNLQPQTASASASAGSEVTAAGSEVAAAGSEVAAAGSEVTAAGSEVAAAGSEVTAAGSEVVAAGTSPSRRCSAPAESAAATADGVSLPPAAAAPPLATGAARQPAPSPSQSRLQAWMRDAAVPLPPPAAPEAVPQRVQSQRRNAEAKVQAAQLLKARRLQGGSQGKKRRGAAARRRPALSTGAAHLSESSDSE